MIICIALRICKNRLSVLSVSLWQSSAIQIPKNSSAASRIETVSDFTPVHARSASAVCCTYSDSPSMIRQPRSAA